MTILDNKLFRISTKIFTYAAILLGMVSGALFILSYGYDVAGLVLPCFIAFIILFIIATTLWTIHDKAIKD